MQRLSTLLKMALQYNMGQRTLLSAPYSLSSSRPVSTAGRRVVASAAATGPVLQQAVAAATSQRGRRSKAQTSIGAPKLGYSTDYDAQHIQVAGCRHSCGVVDLLATRSWVDSQHPHPQYPCHDHQHGSMSRSRLSMLSPITSPLHQAALALTCAHKRPCGVLLACCTCGPSPTL